MKCPECGQEINEDDETFIIAGREYHKECLTEEEIEEEMEQPKQQG
ncbi:hypothetical protein [Pseudomonas sp. NPDC089406]